MILAAIGVTLFLGVLAVVLLVNTVGYFSTAFIYRRRDRRQEQLAERAAKRAVKLALEALHGDSSCGPTHS
jgi:hypothetical protein